MIKNKGQKIKTKEKENRIKCFDCFFHKQIDGNDYCMLIHNEYEEPIIADRPNCILYLNKKEDSELPCEICGRNLYGKYVFMKKARIYCYDCYMKNMKKQRIAEEIMNVIDKYIH